MCACLWKPEEGVDSPRAGILGGCEATDVDFRHQLGSPRRALRALSPRAVPSVLILLFPTCDFRQVL